MVRNADGMTTKTAPTDAPGYETLSPRTGVQVPGWAAFQSNGLEQLEDVPALMWPNSNRTYHVMRSDPQVDALTKAVRFPLQKLKWVIKPNGAKDEVVEDVSSQLQLPIQGNNDPFILRGRKRFDHDDHLRLALLAPLAYGHMPFAMAGDIIAETLMWKLRRLSVRMPHTIMKFDIASDGGLNAIYQAGAATQMNGIKISINEMIMYVWEREGGNWAGRSMLRPLYKPWLLKDRDLRVNAMKNERFGLGIPTGTAPPGGDPADYQKMASAIRASENGGAGLPNGASLDWKGVSGGLPDILASIRMHDESMARSFLAMLLQLGQTETGSRALGDTFQDFFKDSLLAIAKWYCGFTNNYLIEDIVDWNWGEDEQAPLLGWEDESSLSTEDLANLVQSGALVVDAEVQQWIRGQVGAPDYTGGAPIVIKPPAEPVAADRSVTTRKRKPATVHSHAAHDQKTHGRRTKKVADEPNEPLVKITHASLAEQAVCGSSQTRDSETIGHREPNEVEVKAKTDFAKIQKAWQNALAKLVDDFTDVREEQLDDLYAQVEAAVEAGDTVALANIGTTIIGDEVILDHLESMAATSISDALSEAKKQGVTLPAVTVDDLAVGLKARAEAVGTLMARSVSDSAARQALLRFGVGALDPAEVAAGVIDHLESLSVSHVNDVLGGALTQAQNTARRAVMDQADVVFIYSSELLDQNTCTNCSDVDGTEYKKMADADKDYPAGGFKDCLGGPRCRGTLVAVYEEGQN